LQRQSKVFFGGEAGHDLTRPAVVSPVTISADRSQVAAPQESVASLSSDGGDSAFNYNHK
jgi:hypothetical protein